MRPSILAVLLLLAVAGALRAQVPAGPTANTSPTLTFSGPDELRIGGRTFTGVKTVASRYTKVEDAAKPTKDNGIDEIFLKDIQTGRFFVVHGGRNGDPAGINDMREGFTGNYRGRMVEIVKIDDESNTFGEGSWEVIEGFGKTIKKAFTENLVTSLATGGAGLVVAAILNAASKTTAVTAATAASTATSVGGGLAARAVMLSLLPALKWVAIGLGGFAVLYSLYNGLEAQFRKRNESTIDMITAEEVDQLPDAAPPGYLDGIRTGIGIDTARGHGGTPAAAPGTVTGRTDDPSYQDLPNR
jgi:hypothetical protein